MAVTDKRAAGPDASAEAARWVEDALAHVREWFPEMSEEDLRGPLERAFDLASRTARAEREFHAVFEGELRRVLEERDVMGSAGSVLPGQSTEGPMPFQAIAAAIDEPLAPEPEPEPQWEPEPEPEPDRAREIALAIGALRFHDGLSAEEIQDEHGIDPDYYREVMHWLLGKVDATLDGRYPRHLDRERVAAFASGLEDIEVSLALERHTRECPGCATYVADLLDGAVQMVEPGATGRGRSREPAMQVTAAELRKYVARARSGQRSETPAEPARRRRRAAFEYEWLRPVAKVVLGVGLAATVAVVAIDANHKPGSDRPAGSASGAQVASGKSPLGRTFPKRRGQKPEPTRPAHRRHVERHAAPQRSHHREVTPTATRSAPAPSAPPTSSQPVAPPPAPAPAPAAPSPPPSGGEFGLEP